MHFVPFSLHYHFITISCHLSLMFISCNFSHAITFSPLAICNTMLFHNNVMHKRIITYYMPYSHNTLFFSTSHSPLCSKSYNPSNHMQHAVFHTISYIYYIHMVEIHAHISHVTNSNFYIIPYHCLSPYNNMLFI